VFNVADINLTGKITLTGTDNNICIGVGQTDLGDDNVSIGKNAGAALASGGNDNVFIGTSAGLANATGDNNIAIGVGALLVANEGVSVPSYNVCIGTGAGKDITIGGLNICLGAFSGAADIVFTDGTDIITGASNTCIGNFSGTKNSNDDRSISIGYGTVGNGSDTCTIKALDGTFLQGGTTSSATGFDVASILSLDSVHGSIVDGDVLGAIQFRSTGETSDGSDALLPGAAIWAEAEDTFSSINNSTALVFATADSETALTSANEKMRINNDGRLGIGSNDPDSHVHIKDTATSNTTAALHVECTEINVDAGDTLLWLAWSSDSAVSSTANWIKFHDADGEIGVLESTSTNIDTTFTQTSDIRYKKNITDTSLEGLTTLNKIKIRDFEWNDKRGASRDGVEVTAGFIADEVYEFYPAATKGTPGAMKDILDEDGNKTGEEIDAMGIMEGAFIRLLMKAVQELSAKMDTMQTEINTLKEG